MTAARLEGGVERSQDKVLQNALQFCCWVCKKTLLFCCCRRTKGFQIYTNNLAVLLLREDKGCKTPCRFVVAGQRFTKSLLFCCCRRTRVAKHLAFFVAGGHRFTKKPCSVAVGGGQSFKKKPSLVVSGGQGFTRNLAVLLLEGDKGLHKTLQC